MSFPGTLRAAAALGALLLAAPASDASTLRDAFTTRLGPLPDVFAVAVARSIPTLAASTAFSYQFDLETGAFVRVAPVLGQLFLERATTLGARRINVNLSYQYVSFTSFDGEELDELRDTSPLIIDPMGNALLQVPKYAIDLETHQTTLSVTYGLTADTDVNITLPFLYTHLGIDARLRSINSLGQAQPLPSSTSDGKAGIGDILLRGKYRALDHPWTSVALGLLLRLPSGEEENFQGTGTFEVFPAVYLSPRELPIFRHVTLRPYLNAGANLVPEDVGDSEARWGVGIDLSLSERLTAATAVLGRHAFSDLAEIDVPRCLDSRQQCAQDLPDLFTVRRGTAPLFGIGGERPDYYDLSVGLRGEIWRDRLVGFANVLLPLNEDGPRAEAIPLIGMEATF